MFRWVMDRDKASLISLLETAIERVKEGAAVGITIGYQTPEGICRIICSEGDIEIPQSMEDQMNATGRKILGNLD